MAAAEDAQRELALADEAGASLDLDRLVAHLSAAIRGFTTAGEPARAAMVCARLGDVYANRLGNQAAARAWFRRATRLVEDLPPCVEQGWVAVAALGCEVDDPDDLLARADLALARARHFDDADLEAKALADGGLAHVQAGRIPEGMAMLDEAMALVCGGPENVGAAGKSVCSFFTACYFAADHARAATWVDLLRRNGLIGPNPGGPLILSTHCDSVEAAMLIELGRWSDAEAMLQRAIDDHEAVMGPAWHPAIAMADLRIRQDRLADAEILLLGKDSSIQALLPSARLHLARGDHELARAAARRGLRCMAEDRLRAVELLTILVDASLALDDADTAVAAADDLDARSEGLELPILRARVDAARARVRAARGDHAGAVALLEARADGLEGSAPWLQATLRLELARLHEQLGDGAAALVEAKAAAAALADLDVCVPAADLAVLDRLGIAHGLDPSEVRSSPPARLARDGRWWQATDGITSVRLPDSKGLRYLAHLIARPGVEQHVLDLVDRVEGVDASAVPIDRRALGDAGDLADGEARAAYRRRVEALRSEIDEAIALDHLERAEALQVELDQLVGQLASAFGLGGKARTAGSATEKARLNVTRALRAATKRLGQAVPGAGDAVDRHLRTGVYCAYEPSVDDVRWTVEP